jgi:hypothetical protein
MPSQNDQRNGDDGEKRDHHGALASAKRKLGLAATRPCGCEPPRKWCGPIPTLAGITLTGSVLLQGCVVIIVAHPYSEVDFDIGGAFKVAPSVGVSRSTQTPTPGSNRED